MQQPVRVFVGTYTAPIAPDLDLVPGTTAVGVYVYLFDPVAGHLWQECPPAESTNPSFLIVDRSGRYLYAINEVASLRGKTGGAVTAFSIDSLSGELTPVRTVTSGGAGPCHVKLTSDGKNLLVANFLGGSLARIPVSENGEIDEPVQLMQHEGESVHPTMQTKAHAHMAIADPVTGIIYAPDLGADHVYAYSWSEDGRLVSEPSLAIRTAAGAGPRHMDFAADGVCGYLINELDSTVAVFGRDETGKKLVERQVISTLPQGYAGSNAAAAINVHPSGKFLYASNRGHDSVVIYAIEPEDGTLEWLGHVPSGGKSPRHMTFDPDAKHLLVANHDSDTIGVFSIDDKTGNLEEVERCTTPAPACLATRQT